MKKDMDSSVFRGEAKDTGQPSVDGLIARLEAAQAGSADLSWAIAEALGWAKFWCGQMIYVPPGEVAEQVKRDPLSVSAVPDDCGATGIAPRCTTSIDAALSLLPPGWWLQHLGHNLEGWGARVETQGISIPASTHIPRSKTPALALCAAALRAHQAMPQTVAKNPAPLPNTEESNNNTGGTSDGGRDNG